MFLRQKGIWTHFICLGSIVIWDLQAPLVYCHHSLGFLGEKWLFRWKEFDLKLVSDTKGASLSSLEEPEAANRSEALGLSAKEGAASELPSAWALPALAPAATLLATSCPSSELLPCQACPLLCCENVFFFFFWSICGNPLFWDSWKRETM